MAWVMRIVKDIIWRIVYWKLQNGYMKIDSSLTIKRQNS